MPAELPLFAQAQPPAEPPNHPPEPPSPLHAALGALEPDRMSPRDALEAIYALQALMTVSPEEAPVS